ncbi:MAG: hypothetical protein WKF56_06025, partial [Candidatus Limnocylindrales bacterium]
GLSGRNDPANRGSFPWDESCWDAGLRADVRAVLRLRTLEPALRHGVLSVLGTAGRALAFERRFGEERLVVGLNPGDAAVVLPVSLAETDLGRLEPIDLDRVEGNGSERPTIELHAGSADIPIAPWSGRVLRFRPA